MCETIKNFICDLFLHQQIHRIQAENADGIRENVAKDMARLEQRLGQVETKIKQQDKHLDNKLKTVSVNETHWWLIYLLVMCEGKAHRRLAVYKMVL